jgi:hypothetical protein
VNAIKLLRTSERAQLIGDSVLKPKKSALVLSDRLLLQSPVLLQQITICGDAVIYFNEPSPNGSPYPQ